MPDLKKTDEITLRFKKVADRPGAMTVFGQSLNGPESTVLLEAGVSFHVRCEGGQLVLATRAGDPDRLTEGEECVDILMRYNTLGGIRDGERPRLFLRRLVEEVIRLQALEMERPPGPQLDHGANLRDPPPEAVQHAIRQHDADVQAGSGGLGNAPGADLVDANLKPVEEIEANEKAEINERRLRMLHDRGMGANLTAEQAGKTTFAEAKAAIQEGQKARGEPQSEDAQEKF